MRTRALVVAPGRHDLPGGFDPVHLRHADVHEHDVGLGVAHDPDAPSAPSAASPTTAEIGRRVDEHSEAGAHQRLVVDDHDADHEAASALEGKAGRHPEPALRDAAPADSEPS